MLHIVLLVLKIIGIILASVLGLLIVLILTILFVPIRYKLKAEYSDQLKAAARASWLLRIISFSAEYNTENFALKDSIAGTEEEQINLRMRLKIFGRIIFDSSRKKEDLPDKEVKGRKLGFSFKKKPAKSKEDRYAQERKVPENDNLKDPQSAAGTVYNDLKDKASRAELTRISRAEAEAVTGSEEETSSVDTEVGKIGNKENQEDVQAGNSISQTPASDQLGQELKTKGVITEESHHNEIQMKSISKETEDNSQNKKNKFLSAIKKFIETLKGILNKIKAFFVGIKLKKESIADSLKKLYDKYSLVKVFFQDEKNKLGLKYGYNKLKGLLKHVKPRKLIAYIEYGTGDPSSTGQLLGVAAAFMGAYGDSVKLIPDFEDRVFRGNFYCRGRIHALVLLIIGIKVICNRDIKILIRNFQALKEEI